MTTEELHRTVVDGFRQNDEHFAAIDERFIGVDGRLASMDGSTASMDGSTRSMDDSLASTNNSTASILNSSRCGRRCGYHDALEARILEQSETMRRHFDVMVERVEAAVRIVAEGHVHLRTVLDNHEVRLQAIEKHE